MQSNGDIFTYDTIKPEAYDQEFYPRISVIVPSYNQGDFLERTLLSVINQNYPNLELIVIDGGSSDQTPEILKKYSTHFAYVVSEPDTGQANAINKGFSRATGDLIGWLNSDDCYTPGALYHLADAYNSYPDVTFFYGDAVTIDDQDNIVMYWKANFVLDRYLRFGGLIASHAAFWKPQIHQDIDENLYCSIDYELWLRIAKGAKKKHIRFALGAYRFHIDTKSASDRWRERWQADHVYIEQKYGVEPKRGSLLNYEFQYLQRIYHALYKIWPRLKTPFKK